MKNRTVGAWWRRNGRVWFWGSLSLLTAIAIGWSQVPAVAQITQATVAEIIDGDEVFVETEKARLDQIAQFGQVISTEDSRAGLVFLDEIALGRLGEDSSVTVGQCVEVREGQLIASGPVNGCISGFVADVRGTIFIVDAEDEDGNFKVLEGSVQVASDRLNEPIEVGQLQQLGQLDDEEPQVTRIDFEDLVRILSGVLFRGFEVELPNQDRLIAICNAERLKVIEEADEAGPILAARLPQCPTELGVRFGPVINSPF